MKKNRLNEPFWKKTTMPAFAQPSTTQTTPPGPILRVWSPDQNQPILTSVENEPEHRIAYPVLGKTRKKRDADGQKEIWSTSPIDPEVAAAAARMTAEFSSPTISEEHRQWLRSNLSMRQFYGDWMLPERESACAAGKLTPATVEKDLQAVTRWEKLTQPDNWNSDRHWPGVPIGLTTGPLVDHFLKRMKSFGYADGTILSTKNHLSTILHRAERLRLVDPFQVTTPNVERSDNRCFSDHEAISVYRILANHPDLQAAFVLALATGARPSDLFSLEWSNVRLTGLPVVRFVAKKTKRTGERLVVPLMPHVVRHLERLLHRGGWLFPGLGSPTAKNPEHSTVSRNRTSTIKGLMLAAGVFDLVDGHQVEIEKPFQVCRSTAATWIERAAAGMSSTLLGHSDDERSASRVTRIHYLPSEMEPCPELIAAVNEVKWPSEMLLK